MVEQCVGADVDRSEYSSWNVSQFQRAFSLYHDQVRTCECVCVCVCVHMYVHWFVWVFHVLVCVLITKKNYTTLFQIRNRNSSFLVMGQNFLYKGMYIMVHAITIKVTI